MADPMPSPNVQHHAKSTSRARNWRARVVLWIWPVLAVLAVTLPHITDGDWQRGDSGFYAAVGLQAWRSGELWTLHAGPPADVGTEYFNKPPIAFWVTGLAMHIFGASALVLRLTTVVAACACVLMTGAIARTLSSRSVAFGAMIATALNLEFFRRTHELSLDMFQLVWFMCAILCAVFSVKRHSPRLLVLCGLPIGLALMTKPLLGLVALGLIGAWVLWTVRPHTGSSCPHPRPRPHPSWLLACIGALFASLAVALPWHMSMAMIHGREFTDQYFGAQIASRTAGSMTTGAGSTTTHMFYIEHMLSGAVPWIALALLGVGLWIVRAVSRRGMLTNLGQLESLWLVWFVGWLALLTLFPDRRDRYALVLHPAIGSLAGAYLATVRLGSIGRSLRWLRTRLGPVAVVLGLVAALVPVRAHTPINDQWPALFTFLRSTHADELERTAGYRLDRFDQIWAGAWAHQRGARIFHEFGAWPRLTRSRTGELLTAAESAPMPGDLLLYHARDGWAPGESETVVFTHGDITVTTLGADEWLPIEIADPGQREQ